MDQHIDPELWQRFKDKARARWNKLTDEDLSYIQGNADLAAVRLRERYDIPEEEAAREWAEFRQQCVA